MDTVETNYLRRVLTGRTHGKQLTVRSKLEVLVEIVFA